MNKLFILLLFFTAFNLQGQSKTKKPVKAEQTDPASNTAKDSKPELILDTILATFKYLECDTCISQIENGFIIGAARTTDKSKFPPLTQWIVGLYLDANLKPFKQGITIWKVEQRKE